MVAPALNRGTASGDAGPVVRILPFAVVAVGAVPIVVGHAGLAMMGLIAVMGGAVLLQGFRRWPTQTTLGVFVVSIAEHAASGFLPGPLRGLAKTADEPLVLMLVIGTVLFLVPGRAVPVRRYVYVPVAFILFGGWVSDLLNLVPVVTSVVGTWQFLKFWALLFVTIHLPWGRREVAALVRVFTLVTVVVMAFAVLNLVAESLFRRLVPVSAASEVRFGSTGLQSVFTHPGHFGAFATFMAVFFLARFIHSGHRRDLAIAVWCLGLGFLSFRFKVILGFVGALATLGVAAPQRFFRRVGAGILLLLLAVSLGGGIVTDLATEQIDRYLLDDDDTTIREALYVTGGEIARDNFPFGEGFGRFGTGAATQFNSPVYDEYGIGGRRGLSQEVPGVRHDTTWPTVIGETGYLGFVAYFGGVIAIWLRLLHQARRASDPDARWLSLATLAVLSNVLLESLARPSFFQAFTTLSLALLIGASLVVGRSSGGVTAARAAVAVPARRGAQRSSTSIRHIVLRGTRGSPD